MNAITFNELPSAVSRIYEKLENIEQLISENKKAEPEEDRLMTVQEAAELTHLSIPTIYGLVSKVTIPCMKRGKRLYFSKHELISWIKSGRKKQEVTHA